MYSERVSISEGGASVYGSQAFEDCFPVLNNNKNPFVHPLSQRIYLYGRLSGRNIEKMFPVNICKLEGMEGTTTRQIADYIRSLPERVDAEMVVRTLETWIEKHGLKAEFGQAIRFIRDLKNRE